MPPNEGERARLRQPIIAGTIVEHEYDRKTGEKRCLLEWSADGEAHQRWFPESDLEADASEPLAILAADASSPEA